MRARYRAASAAAFVGLAMFAALAAASRAARAEVPPAKPGGDVDVAPIPGTPKSLSWFRPTGLIEVDHRVFRTEEEGLTGFGLGRLRLGAVITPAPWVRGVVSLEMGSGILEVLDAFVQFKPHDAITIDVGSTKPPLFASYRDEPAHTTPFPDRGRVVDAFTIQRDVGAGIRVAPAQIPVELNYRVGNGSGSVVSNDNPYPAVHGAADLVLGRAWLAAHDPDGEPETFGLRLGLGGMEENAADRDSIKGVTPLGFVYARPIVVAGIRRIGAAYAIGYAGPVRLTFEGAIADESRNRDDDGNIETPRRSLSSVESHGATAEVAWVIVGEPREVGHAPRAKPGPWRGGALEVAARFDALWLLHGSDDPSVTENDSRGGSLSLKWWPTSFMAATVSGSFTAYDVPPVETPDVDATWGVLQRLSLFWPPTK